MALKTEQDTPEMSDRIEDAADVSDRTQGHSGISTPVFEHGQWWIVCLDCGASWSVVDAVGGPSVDGFDFEQVSEGDESCAEGL